MYKRTQKKRGQIEGMKGVSGTQTIHTVLDFHLKIPDISDMVYRYLHSYTLTDMTRFISVNLDEVNLMIHDLDQMDMSNMSQKTLKHYKIKIGIPINWVFHMCQQAVSSNLLHPHTIQFMEWVDSNILTLMSFINDIDEDNIVASNLLSYF
jgi:hypothetical protein